MTTLAYSLQHRMLAADRQVTGNGVIVGQATKIVKVGGLVGGICGATALCERFLSWFRKGCIGDPPEMMVEGVSEKHDGIGVIFLGDLAVEFLSIGIQTTHNNYFAYGSGHEVALGLLSAGHSPIEAIEHASKLDIYTGQGIDVLRF